MGRITRVVGFLMLATIFGVGCSSSGGETLAPQDNNHPPVLISLNDTTVTVGDTLRMTAVATDPDGDAVRYDLTVMIHGMSDHPPKVGFDGDSGEFVFFPASTDQPSRDFIIRARDGRGGEDASPFTVTVN
jgi:hypothetical protein